MDEEKTPTGKRNLHRCVVCGQAAAILSVFLLVPMIRKRRAQHQKHRRHGFPLLGH